MKDDQPKASEPDIAAGSLAYMPKADNSSSESDSELELGNNKAAEKKSVADLPDTFGDDEALAEKPVVKPKSNIAITVDGKPKPEVEPKVEPNDSTEMELGTESHVAHVTSAGHAPEAMPPTHHGLAHDMPPQAEKKSAKGLVVALLLVVLIAAAGTLGYLWNTARSDVTKLTSEVSDLKSKPAQASPSSTPLDDSAAASSTSSGDTRLIPELGLNYKLTDNTKKVTYVYSETKDSAGKIRSAIYFSTATLISAERKVVASGKDLLCGANTGPLGNLGVYKAGDIYKTTKVDDLKVDNKTSFKLGTSWYIYEGPQATCSTDKTVSALQTSDRAFVTELLTSLSVAK